MTISNRVRTYLEAHGVGYESLQHPLVFSSDEVAHSMHIPGRMFAKSVVVEVDGRWTMAVLPASLRVNLAHLKEAMSSRHLRLGSEDELAKICPDCELGAFPPFGNLYGMEVWVDRSLAASEEIAFNAGTHRDALRMRYADFAELVKPVVADFGEARAA